MARNQDLESVERSLTLLLRLARTFSIDTAQALAPGLEPQALSLLIRINDEGQVRAADLADYFGVGRPTISRQLAVLHDLGLVASHPNEADGRSLLIALTDQGEKRLQEVRAQRRKRFRSAFSEWSEDEISQLAASLHKLMATRL